MLNEPKGCAYSKERSTINKVSLAKSVNKIAKELHLVPGWVLILYGHRRFIGELLWCKLWRRGP